VMYGVAGSLDDSYLGFSGFMFEAPMPTMLPTGSAPSTNYSHFFVGI